MSAHTLSDARRLSAKETASLIRAELKATFPAVKFSVRIQQRSTTINVHWTDGPTTRRVEEIAGQFEGKGLDGSIDMEYHVDGWLLNGEIVGTRSRGTEGSRGSVAAWGMVAPHDDCELVAFGAGYIFCTRKHSPAFVARLAALIAARYGFETPAIGISSYDGSAWINATTAQDHEAWSKVGAYWGELIHRAADDRSAFLDVGAV